MVTIDRAFTYSQRRHVVCGTDDERIFFLSGARGGPTVKRSIEVKDRLIIGFQTPAAVPDDPMLMLAKGQQKLGVPASGVFTAETQEAITSALKNGGVSLSVLWQTFLAGLGYAPDDTARFQMVEGLPQTGIADWATWRRAYQYLGARA